MNITVGVCGSIAAYKAASLVSFLSKEHNVKVIMTQAATKFVTPLTFQALSKNSVITDIFDENEPEHINHIHYAQECDCVIIAPATANIIAKAAHGIADDALSSTIMASNKPILFVPAMNTVMYENSATMENMHRLQQRGCYFVAPEKGELACGASGRGKYPSTRKITSVLGEILSDFE